MNKGLAIQHSKKQFKNDHNNHLSPRLEQLNKVEPSVTNEQDSAFQASYETHLDDIVTFAYVRGYN